MTICSVFNAQVAIGKTSVDNSAVLDISGATNKGVLLPRVDIVDILNNTSPVSNPKEGLIVYSRSLNFI